MFDCVFEYISASFFPGTLGILLGKEVLQGKKGESRNEFCKMVGETSPIKLLVLTKKSLYHLIK